MASLIKMCGFCKIKQCHNDYEYCSRQCQIKHIEFTYSASITAKIKKANCKNCQKELTDSTLDFCSKLCVIVNYREQHGSYTSTTYIVVNGDGSIIDRKDASVNQSCIKCCVLCHRFASIKSFDMCLPCFMEW